MHRIDPLFYEPFVDKKSEKVVCYDNRRVKLRDLGGYCHAVQGVRVPAEELDQEVKVGNPFTRFYRHRPGDIDCNTLGMTPDEFDELLTHVACDTLRAKIEARPDVSAWVADKETEDARDRLYEAWNARAGAALWLFERDKRRCLVNCGKYAFSLMCGGMNFELDGSETHRGYYPQAQPRIAGYDVDARLGAPLGNHVCLRAKAHVLRDGVYIRAVCLYTTVNVGQRVKTTSDNPQFMEACPGLSDKIVEAARQAAIERQMKNAEYEQDKLDTLKKLLELAESGV